MADFFSYLYNFFTLIASIILDYFITLFSDVSKQIGFTNMHQKKNRSYKNRNKNNNKDNEVRINKLNNFNKIKEIKNTLNHIKEKCNVNKEVLDNIFYTKSDTLLRAEASSSSKILIVLIKGTKLIYLKSSVTKDDGTIYDKVKIIKNNIYQSEIIGFVLRRQLSFSPIESEINNISVQQKTEIIKEALSILKRNTGYSMDIKKRLGGFYNIEEENTLFFDCSSFCSTILNRIFNIPLFKSSCILTNEFFKEKNKEIKGTNKVREVWTTYHYLEDLNKKKGIFQVVQYISTPGQKIYYSNLQVGDLILGVNKKIHKGINHIMIYVGEGYIIHCTRGYYLGIKTNQFRSGVVKDRLTEENYFTELETKENLKNGNITKCFDQEIYVLRYKKHK